MIWRTSWRSSATPNAKPAKAMITAKACKPSREARGAVHRHMSGDGPPPDALARQVFATMEGNDRVFQVAGMREVEIGPAMRCSK